MRREPYPCMAMATLPRSAQSAPRVGAVGRAVPPNYVTQAEVTTILREWWRDRPEVLGRFESLQRAVRVEGRHFAQPAEAYSGREPFAERNASYTRVALDLGEAAVREALARASLAPSAVDHLFFVT